MKKKFIDKSRRNDRIAEVMIRIGGVFVIVAVVWILVMISRVALPLFYPSSAHIAATLKLPSDIPSGKILAVGTEDSRQGAFTLDETGSFHFLKVADGSLSASIKTPTIPAGAVRVVLCRTCRQIGLQSALGQWCHHARYRWLWPRPRDADGTYSLTHEITPRDELSFRSRVRHHAVVCPPDRRQGCCAD